MLGLHIGEGLETCLGSPAAGVGSASGIAAFPARPGIQAYHRFGQVNDGGAYYGAAEAWCASRWIEVLLKRSTVAPLSGNDLNDVWREVAP